MTTKTIVQADTWKQLSPARRADIREWAKANKLEADDIMISEPITVKNNEIFYTALMRNEDGTIKTPPGTFSTTDMVMSSGNLKVMVEKRKAPLLEPFEG